MLQLLRHTLRACFVCFIVRNHRLGCHFEILPAADWYPAQRTYVKLPTVLALMGLGGIYIL